MGQTLHALTVDDNENDVLLMVRMLRRSGYRLDFVRVDNAEDMSAALDHGRFDIVFLDHSMPQFSELAALEILGARGLTPPCIIVSGGIPESDLKAALKAGAHEFVPKQSLEQIGPAVERVFRRVAG